MRLYLPSHLPSPIRWGLGWALANVTLGKTSYSSDLISHSHVQMTSSIWVIPSKTLAAPLAVKYMTAQKLGATEIKLTQASSTK